mgnify:CR=1 FL=1
MGRAFEYRKARKMKRWGHMARVFTKIGKEIEMAVKASGPDPSSNLRLRLLMQNAKAENMPKENVERAIKRATEKDAADYKEVIYEGYGAHGVAFIVECLTDNRNRTAADVRAAFSKYGGNLGTTGCVSFMFEEKGVIVIMDEDGEIEEDKLMETALEAGAEDFNADEEVFEIYTEPSDLSAVKEALVAAGYTIASAELDKIPSSYVTLESDDDIKNMNLLIEHLEDNDDVQDIYHNWENCDE